MYANSAVRNLIREAKPHQITSIIQTSRQSGMITMDDAIYELFQAHQICAEDAMEFAQDKSNLLRRIPMGGSVVQNEGWQETTWDDSTFGTGGF